MAKDQKKPSEAETATQKPGARAKILRPAKTKKRSRRRAVASGFVAMIIAGLAFCAILIFAVMVGRTMDLPDWVARDVEKRANAQFSGETIKIETVSFGLHDEAYRPTFRLKGVQLFDTEGVRLMTLPSVQAKFDFTESLQGRLAAESLTFDGANLNLSRGLDGRLSLGFGDALSGDGETRTLAEVLAKIDSFLEDPLVADMDTVSAQNLRLNFADARTGETVVIENGTVTMTNAADSLDLVLRFDLSVGGSETTQMQIAASKPKGVPSAELMLTFNEISAAALGRQIGALNFLSLLEAPASGALSAVVNAEGALDSLAGSLTIGSGFVRPAEQASALQFDAAKLYLRYGASEGRLFFDEISVDAPELRLTGEGYTDLQDLVAGVPQTLLSQLTFRDITIDPEGILETPVTFDQGILDLRYKSQDLHADIGQLVLRNEGTEIVTDGKVRVGPDGWEIDVNANIGEIEKSRLLALWPKSVSGNTRRWLTENIQAGSLKRASAAVRLRPKEAPKTAVSFDFDDAQVRYLKTLPVIENASGYVSIDGKRFFLSVREGHVEVPARGALYVSGSTFEISDITAKPAIGDVDLQVDGAVLPALALLDFAPFEFLQKADLTPEIATGRAAVQAGLSFPLIKQLKVEEVFYEVAADLRDIRSESLIKDRVLTADAMKLAAGDGALSIGGKAKVDDIPVDVIWSRALGKGSGDTSQITGQVELSPAALEAFNIDLPPGSVSGSGTGQIEIALEKGTPPQLRLRSDLEGVGLRIPALEWRKAASQTMELDTSVTLGPVPKVNTLTLSGAGLDAQAVVDIRPEGGLNVARFDRLTVGDKFNSRVELVGQGRGRPARVNISGGVLDIRKFGIEGSSGSGAPIELALDELVISDSISIRPFRGNFSTASGLDGQFSGKVNGRADVRGVVVPTPQGPAIRITSENGGAVLAASGIFKNAREGEMSLILRPNGQPGQFDGRLEIENARIKNAPALADLLSALSVIGLLEQLSGNGILFSTVEADFTLSPGGVTLKRSSAVGPSMGITMEGVFNTSTNRMQMQGVVSPIYVVNGLFGALFSPRKGEGLFGFNYGLRGAADAPRVSVNPLSMLTPGIFREIFRRAPPKLQN